MNGGEIPAGAALPRAARRVRVVWAALRRLATDDAYERYLEHHATYHAGTPALDRKAFYLAEQQRKWSGVQRCC